MLTSESTEGQDDDDDDQIHLPCQHSLYLFNSG
uniref:Uncharacterized protein n=1 Tax=Tetranychus urticae TaxID=32264 RepID=T1KUU1_TETUR